MVFKCFQTSFSLNRKRSETPELKGFYRPLSQSSYPHKNGYNGQPKNALSVSSLLIHDRELGSNASDNAATNSGQQINNRLKNSSDNTAANNEDKQRFETVSETSTSVNKQITSFGENDTKQGENTISRKKKKAPAPIKPNDNNLPDKPKLSDGPELQI